MKKLFLLIIAIAFIFMGCVTTQESQIEEPVQESSSEIDKGPLDLIEIGSYEIYNDDSTIYITVEINVNQDSIFSVFAPGFGYTSGGLILPETESIVAKMERADYEKGEGIAIWFMNIERIIRSMPKRIILNPNINWDAGTGIPDEIISRYENNPAMADLELSSEADFRSKRPWIPADSVFVENTEWDPADPWSSRFDIQDNTDLPFTSNENYLGEWRVYGEVPSVTLSSSELSPQSIYETFKSTGEAFDAEYASRWPDMTLFKDGTADCNMGNRWTDGWMINDKEIKLGHLFYYLEEESGNELIFLENKTGDYNRGLAPEYQVYIRKE